MLLADPGSHAPADYPCPFCSLVRGDYARTWARTEDLVLQDEHVTAFVSPEQWPRNPGHVLVIPNAHHENLYELPDTIGARIHAASRLLVLAMKRAWACDGTSTRQHNEPAGNQEVWHYHLHVFPRWHGDALYASRKARIEPAARARQAAELRAVLAVSPEPAAR